MKTPRRFLLAAAAAAVLAGCTTLRSEHVLTGSPSAPWTGEVKVSMEGAPVAGEYEEVAIVSASGSAFDGLPTVLGALRERAASLGCNAVVRIRYDRGTSQTTATGVAVRMR